MNVTKYFLIAFVLFCDCGHAQNGHDEIMAMMDRQSECWNRGDLDCFMEGYWKSDSLKFIGKSGVTYGWNATLDRYKTNYPDKAAMGHLRFDILHLDDISPDSKFMVGKWFLKREDGDIGGHFTLLWRKVGGQWVIVADHSS